MTTSCDALSEGDEGWFRWIPRYSSGQPDEVDHTLTNTLLPKASLAFTWLATVTLSLLDNEFSASSIVQVFARAARFLAEHKSRPEAQRRLPVCAGHISQLRQKKVHFSDVESHPKRPRTAGAAMTGLLEVDADVPTWLASRTIRKRKLYYIQARPGL